MSAGYSATLAIGRVQASEQDILFVPRTKRTGKSGVILLHGAGSNSTMFTSKGWPNLQKVVEGLLAAGIPCLAQDVGTTGTPPSTTDLYANDTTMSRITSCYNYLRANTVATSTKVLLLGVSMGGANSIRWAILNPTLVGGVIGFIPGSDINYAYKNNNPPGVQAPIGTAWGVATDGSGTLPGAADLPDLVTSLNGVVPGTLYYSTDDPYIPPTNGSLGDATSRGVVTTAANAGWTAVAGTGGHSDTRVGQASVSSIVQFMLNNGA